MKLNINKKGSPAIYFLVAAITALLVLIWQLGLLGALIGAGESAVTMVGQNAWEDFDRDKIINSADECPCGSPVNEVNKRIMFDRTWHCVSGIDPGFTMDDCKELAKQEESYRVEVINGKVEVKVGQPLKIITKLEQIDNKEMCLYTKPKNFACPSIKEP